MLKSSDNPHKINQTKKQVTFTQSTASFYKRKLAKRFTIGLILFVLNLILCLSFAIVSYQLHKVNHANNILISSRNMPTRFNNSLNFDQQPQAIIGNSIFQCKNCKKDTFNAIAFKCQMCSEHRLLSQDLQSRNTIANHSRQNHGSNIHHFIQQTANSIAYITGYQCNDSNSLCYLIVFHYILLISGNIHSVSFLLSIVTLIVVSLFIVKFFFVTAYLEFDNQMWILKRSNVNKAIRNLTE